MREAVAADFNQDGHLDLVVTTSFIQAPPTSHKINLLTNDGTGVFAQKAPIALGNAGGVAVADFDKDGRLDLAVTSTGAAQCLGQGTAVFLAQSGDLPFAFRGPCLTGMVNPVAVQAGDFNGDGRADLAVASNFTGVGGGMKIFFGNGDGSFQPGQLVNSSGLNVQDMAPAVDVNGDGLLDLVVAASNTFRAFLGRADGTFDAGATTVTGDNTLAVAVADLTGEGRPDLATIELFNGSTQLRVRRGLANGAFDVGIIVSQFAPGAADVAIADLDSDGDMDIAVAGGTNNRARLFLNDGGGSFATGGLPLLGSDPFRAVAGDFNTDGLSDIAMITPRNAPAQVFVALQNDRLKPTIDITAPADGSTVSGNVTINATASDNSGISKVDFFANDMLIGSSTGPNYTINWNASALAGNFTIRARAFDGAGNFADDSVAVTVADIAAPSAPTNLTGRSLRNFHEALLNWTASTDNAGVSHYRLYELVRVSGKQTAWELVDARIEGTTTVAEIRGRRGHAHAFAVTAVDAAGNESVRSEPVEVSRDNNDRGNNDRDDNDRDDNDRRNNDRDDERN